MAADALVPGARLERHLDTPARIYYKYEGVSPAGSHKPNTAVAQAYYNKEEGITRIATETGAGQWGSALALAGSLFGLEVDVYMVRVSFDQKPYRRALMESYGARCVASPSEETGSGRKILAEHPDSTGSLGIAISEAVEMAAKRDDTHYALGSVLNHVLLHQTVIGQEAIAQLEQAGDYPDVVVGCTGGGNFAGIAFPFIGAAQRGGRKVRVVACEPVACPSLTRGRYAYDFGDTGHLTPLVKMHTLGSEFIPPGFMPAACATTAWRRWSGHLLNLGLIEAVAQSSRVLRGRGRLRARRGHCAGAGGEPCGQGRDRSGAAGQGSRRGQGDPVQSVRPWPLRHAGLRRLLRRQAHRPELRRGGPPGRARSPAQVA